MRNQIKFTVSIAMLTIVGFYACIKPKIVSVINSNPTPKFLANSTSIEPISTSSDSFYWIQRTVDSGYKINNKFKLKNKCRKRLIYANSIKSNLYFINPQNQCTEENKSYFQLDFYNLTTSEYISSRSYQYPTVNSQNRIDLLNITVNPTENKMYGYFLELNPVSSQTYIITTVFETFNSHPKVLQKDTIKYSESNQFLTLGNYESFAFDFKNEEFYFVVSGKIQHFIKIKLNHRAIAFPIPKDVYLDGLAVNESNSEIYAINKFASEWKFVKLDVTQNLSFSTIQSIDFQENLKQIESGPKAVIVPTNNIYLFDNIEIDISHNKIKQYNIPVSFGIVAN